MNSNFVQASITPGGKMEKCREGTPHKSQRGKTGGACEGDEPLAPPELKFNQFTINHKTRNVNAGMEKKGCSPPIKCKNVINMSSA